MHYSFEKLYANQSDIVANFKINYASEKSNQLGMVISIVSVILIWIGIFLLRMNSTSNRIIAVVITLGVLGLLTSVAFIQSQIKPAFSIALIGGALYISMVLMTKYKHWVNKTH